MTLSRTDKEFRHEGISYLDYKQVEMDRVLTAFLPRLWWDGQPSRIARSGYLGIEDFVELIEGHPEAFVGFDNAVTRRWVETHLLEHRQQGQAKPGGGRPAAVAWVHLPAQERPPVPAVRRG